MHGEEYEHIRSLLLVDELVSNLELLISASSFVGRPAHWTPSPQAWMIINTDGSLDVAN